MHLATIDLNTLLDLQNSDLCHAVAPEQYRAYVQQKQYAPIILHICAPSKYSWYYIPEISAMVS